MARIEWVKQRLDNWAMWKERSDSGGLGFPSASSFTREAVTPGYHETSIPVNDIEASITDEAVTALRELKPDLYDTLQCIYVAGIGVAATARSIGCDRSTIAARLDRADLAIAEWLEERSRKREAALRAQDAARKSFTT